MWNDSNVYLFRASGKTLKSIFVRFFSGSTGDNVTHSVVLPELEMICGVSPLFVVVFVNLLRNRSVINSLFPNANLFVSSFCCVCWKSKVFICWRYFSMPSTSVLVKDNGATGVCSSMISGFNGIPNERQCHCTYELLYSCLCPLRGSSRDLRMNKERLIHSANTSHLVASKPSRSTNCLFVA